MQELKDDELKMVDGGSWGSIVTVDLSKMKSPDSHYFYPNGCLVKNTDGTYSYDPSKGIQKIKISVNWDALSCRFGTSVLQFKTANQKIQPIVHCFIIDSGGGSISNQKGYIHAGFRNLIPSYENINVK